MTVPATLQQSFTNYPVDSEGVAAKKLQHRVFRCDIVCSQAQRVTQELRGGLKLEAYMRVLQELLLVQLQQASTIHPSSTQVRRCRAAQHHVIYVSVGACTCTP